MIHTSDRIDNLAKSLPKIKRRLATKGKKIAIRSKKTYSTAKEHSRLLKEIGKLAIKHPIKTKRAAQAAFPLSMAAATVVLGYAADAGLQYILPGGRTLSKSAVIPLSSLSIRQRHKVLKGMKTVKDLSGGHLFGLYLYKKNLYSL